MRCDGSDPCAACQTTSSACVYPATVKSTQREDDAGEGASPRLPAASSASQAEESSPAFSLSQPSMDYQPSNTVDLGFLQNLEQIPFALVTDGEVPAHDSVEGGASYDLNLSTTAENALHLFMDPSIMNDIWRMPAVVRKMHALLDIGDLG